jgi:hypothetical protein
LKRESGVAAGRFSQETFLVQVGQCVGDKGVGAGAIEIGDAVPSEIGEPGTIEIGEAGRADLDNSGELKDIGEAANGELEDPGEFGKSGKRLGESKESKGDRGNGNIILESSQIPDPSVSNSMVIFLGRNDDLGVK